MHKKRFPLQSMKNPLAQFSATLRNEVDLQQLRESLVAVVEETMQPAHVLPWLRPAQQDDKRQVARTGNIPPSSALKRKKRLEMI
jgi:hypothetical protein